MKLKIAFLIAGSGLALVFALNAEPTPTPTSTPIKIPGKPKPTPKPPPIKIPGKVTPTPKPPPIKIPGKVTPTPKPPPIKIPGKVTPTPTMGPIKIPGKVTPTPTLGPIKIPGKKITPTPTVKPKFLPNLGNLLSKVTPTPTVGPIKIPGKKITPTVGPIKIPGKKITPTVEPPFDKKKNGTGKNDVHFWINIDVNPPPPSQLIIPSIPVYQSVPASPVNYVPGGVALVPESYNPPPQNAPVEVSPTALRAWNGQEEPPGRAFDQTRVKLSAASEGTASWQFFWQTTGPEPQAARWEVATVPFVGGSTEFPPAGLVGYGDASVSAASPLTESFFAVDFNGFAKNFQEGSVPNKYYMRVVPVDGEGNPAGKPSNFVRVDLP
jgi:hypothetical protein